MLRVDDSWIWDFWLADTGEEYHLFFLRAPRSLIDPLKRHRSASVGHAVSTDLRSWRLLSDAILPSTEPAFDDLAIWTGSVLHQPDGLWRMFYTGLSRADDGTVQRIGSATSSDLTNWKKDPAPALCADPRWYETTGQNSQWPDGEAWRDPWVVADPGGNGWHMLITARANDGDPFDRGVVGHAISEDLRTWVAQPPLSSPGSGFAQLEVIQAVLVDDKPVMLFSCLAGELSTDHEAKETGGGVWSIAAASILGPFDTASAQLLTDDSLYVGKVVRDRDGSWVLLAFHNVGPDGQFVGEISDPLPVRWADTALTLGGSVREEVSSIHR